MRAAFGKIDCVAPDGGTEIPGLREGLRFREQALGENKIPGQRLQYVNPRANRIEIARMDDAFGVSMQGAEQRGLPEEPRPAPAGISAADASHLARCALIVLKGEASYDTLGDPPHPKAILVDAAGAPGQTLAPAGVGASQVDSCRRKRDMPDLRAVVLSRLRIHYR